MCASQGLDINPYRLLDMSEAVAAQLLTPEPPRYHDDVVPKAFTFKHAKNNHARTGFAVIVLDQLITTDKPS